MLKKWNKVLSILLAFALVVTMLGSDFASTRAFAEEGGEALVEAESAQPEEAPAEAPQEEVTQPQENQEVPQEAAETPQEPEVVPEEPAEEPAVEPAESEAAAVEASAEAAAEGSVEATAETSVEAATEASSEAAAEASSVEAVEEEKAVEAKLVTVTYRSTKGGSVSNKEETINILDESAKFEGATAAAWNDEYTFVNWTDADGNQVSEEVTFVPSGITEDATYTANFKAVENIEEKRPAIIADGVHEGGMIVSVRAEEGLFPAGTEVKISAISDSDALATAKDELGEEVKAAKGVDITFVYEGEEIQPADNKYVHVTLDLEQAMDAENVSVLHDHEGNVETIEANISADEQGNVDAVSFDANQFSIFIVAEKDKPENTELKVVEYRFFDNKDMTGEPFNTQLVKNGDKLYNPGIPESISNSDNQVFKKWVDENGDEPSFDTVSGITEDTPDVINYIPFVETTYYIQYHGIDDEIALVKSYTLDDDAEEDDKYVDTYSEYSFDADSGDAFDGWSTSSDLPKSNRPYVQDNGTKNIADVTNPDNRNLYAVIVEAYWIHFNPNAKGVSYTEPIYLVKGDKLSKISSVAYPRRDGYKCVGWSLKPGDEAVALSEAELAAYQIDEMDEVNDERVLDLYAVWEPEGKTTVSVIYWQQKVTDKWDTAEEAKTYDYRASEVLEDIDTGTTVNEEFIASKIPNYQTKYNKDILDRQAFKYNKITVKDTTDGSDTSSAGPNSTTVINVYYDREVITLTFKRYGQLEDYVPASGYDSRITYYGTLDEVEYFAIERKTETTTTFTYNGEEYIGNVYIYYSTFWGSGYREVTDFSQNRTYYGLIDGEYKIITKNENTETKWYHLGTTREYEGDRYQKVTSQNNEWNVVHEFKGLFGQTLAEAGYDWPADTQWYEERSGNQPDLTSTHMTFLDTFFAEDNGNKDIDFFGTDRSSGSSTVSHWKEDLTEGEYTQANSTRASSNGTFYLSNKYDGFELYQYQHGNGAKYDGSTGQGVGLNGGNLNIYYKRKSYTLSFIDVSPINNSESDAGTETVKYEAPLSAYSDHVDSKSYDGYVFKGWYEDATGTVEFNFSSKMPAAGKAVYGIWEPTRYKVTLLGGGGEFVGPDDEWDPEEDFDEDGNPFFTVAPEDEISRLGVDNLFEKEGYTFTGYFYAEGQDNAGEAFLYGKINHDIVIEAQWRRTDAVKVIFDAAPEGAAFGDFGEETTHTDGFDYRSDSEFVVAAPPTNVNEEYAFLGYKFHQGTDTSVHYSNECLSITEEVINDDNEVILDAVYEKKGGPGTSTEKTFVIYNPGDRAGDESLVLNYTAASDMETVDDTDKTVRIDGLKKNEKITALGDIYTADGWEMDHWNTMQDDSGLAVDLNKTFIAADNKDRDDTNTKANVLYAIWKKTVYTVEFDLNDNGEATVTEPADGQVGTDDQTVEHGEKAKEPTAELINREHYALDGWTLDGEDYDFETPVTANITLVAKWRPSDKYTITIEAVADKKSELPYNGKEQTLTITGNENELPYTITITSEPEQIVDGLTKERISLKEELSVSGTNVGTYYSEELTEDMFQIDGEIDAEITWVVSGKIALEITKRKVKITAKGAEERAQFDGNKHEANGFDEEPKAELVETLEDDKENLADEVVIIYDEDVAHAEGVLPAQYDMGLELSMFSFENNNFELDEESSNIEDGYLFIWTEPGLEVKLLAESDDVSSPYNGTEQTFEMPVRIKVASMPELQPMSLPQRFFQAVRDFLVVRAGAADDGVPFTIGEEKYVIKDLKAIASATNVDETPKQFALKDGYAIYHEGDENPVTEYFDIDTEGLGNLTITPVDLTITVDNKTKTVGQADPEFTATVTGLQGEDKLEFAKEDFSRVEGEAVGTYQIDITDLKDPESEAYEALVSDYVNNYNVIYNPGTLTINDAPTQPTPPPDEPEPPVHYGDPVPEPTPAAPAQAVLGARREEPSGQAVLGARRARTEDTTNSTARVFAIVVSAAVALTLLLVGKRKEEDNEEG